MCFYNPILFFIILIVGFMIPWVFIVGVYYERFAQIFLELFRLGTMIISSLIGVLFVMIIQFIEMCKPDPSQIVQLLDWGIYFLLSIASPLVLVLSWKLFGKICIDGIAIKPELKKEEIHFCYIVSLINSVIMFYFFSHDSDLILNPFLTSSLVLGIIIGSYNSIDFFFDKKNKGTKLLKTKVKSLKSGLKRGIAFYIEVIFTIVICIWISITRDNDRVYGYALILVSGTLFGVMAVILVHEWGKTRPDSFINRIEKKAREHESIITVDKTLYKP